MLSGKDVTLFDAERHLLNKTGVDDVCGSTSAFLAGYFYDTQLYAGSEKV